METFVETIELVENPHFEDQKKKNLSHFQAETLDEPIVDLINGLNELPFCFTMQSCYGHFLYAGQDDPCNLDPLPESETTYRVEYRIAYTAFCLDNNDSGKRFLGGLSRISDKDPENIQFGCAKWFWKRQVNSYVLQVEPERYKFKDKIILDYAEALKIEKVRNIYFAELEMFLQDASTSSR